MSMEHTIKIMLAWGGTWGHAIPIISLVSYLRDEWKYQFLWLWERDSLEEELAELHLIDFKSISAGRIRRYFDIRNFYEPFKNLTGICESIYHIIRFRPDFIFSKGWFVALPVCIAAWILRKPVFIHESDSIIWLSNKLCSRFANRIFYTFPWEYIDNIKHIHSGPIMHPDMIEWLSSMQVQENERLKVLIIAGSQWSTIIFDALLGILKDCNDIDFHIILWEKNLHFRERFQKFPHVTSYDFLKPLKLWKLMQSSDIAITRWSSTLWELMHFGIHSIIVPLKATGWNHQTHNGQYFKEKYGFDLLDEESELSLEIFRKLQAYKDTRKSDLHLEWYFDGIQTIEKYLK